MAAAQLQLRSDDPCPHAIEGGANGDVRGEVGSLRQAGGDELLHVRPLQLHQLEAGAQHRHHQRLAPSLLRRRQRRRRGAALIAALLAEMLQLRHLLPSQMYLWP